VGTERGTGLAAMFLPFCPGGSAIARRWGLALCAFSVSLSVAAAMAGAVAEAGLQPRRQAYGFHGEGWGQARQMPSQSLSLHRERRPNGQVQLFDERTRWAHRPVSSTAPLRSTNPGCRRARIQLSAHYLGDTNTMASQAGALNITFVGNTTFTITATPAASNGSPTVTHNQLRKIS